MAAPQLRLEVSLNLAGFRGEIRKLTAIAQSEFVPQINVKFNRRTLNAELNNLQAAIKRRTYHIEIGGNIDSLPKSIKALKEQLSSLESFKIDLGVGAVKSLSKKDASKINSDIRAQILGEQSKIYVPVSIKPSITREDVRNFKNTVKSKLTGLSVDVKANVQGGGAGAGLPPDFMKYMAEQGLLGKTASGMTMRMGKDSGDIKQQLNDAVGSAEKIKSIFDGVAKSIATTGKSIANVQGKRLGLANVPLMAGAMEKRIERSVSAIEGTTSSDALKALYPDINKTIVSLAALRGQVQQNTSKLSGFSLIIGLAAFAGVPLAKSIVKLTGSADKFSKLLDRLGPSLEAAFTKATFNILNTASSRLLSGGSAVGLLPPAYRGIGSSAGPAGLLPPAYRGIGPSRNAGALPGTAFEKQKYLPTGLGQELKEVLRGAANAFLDSIRQNIRTVTIGDLGRVEQRAISGSRVAGYLPPVARFGEGRTPSPYSTGRLGREGETRAELFARREREARMRSALRGVDIMGEGGMAGRAASPYSRAYRAARPQSAIIPYAAGGAIVPSGGGGNIPPTPPRGSGGGGGFSGGMQFNMPQLPGAGLVREIGEEFGFAAKQVLLYGTAYKALGLLQTFPAQVGEAVGALQSFRNTLNAISPTAQEAAASSEFILNIVDKYNVPLQSARDGFTKLYASMAPTGFSGNEIRDLFTGISQAAATFGMSSDKVDRVTYAFAQMASKGQVMSEELKGQLGDVLPGAMGIFAKAAGFEGADAIQKFGKALEDGAYKGKPMRDLLKNVTIELKKEFGPGAEGAARTYQGVMTRMANSTKLLYESFEPVAINFLNSIVVPITGGLKTVTDGFKAFFTGQAAQTTGGGAFAKQLEALRPAFEGIRSNITSLVPIFQSFGKILLATGQVFLQIAGNPFVGYLARVYLNVVALTTVVNILNLRALVPFIANLARSIYSVVAFGVQCTLAGQKAVFFDLMVRTLGTTLRTFFAATAVGIILVGIGLIAEAFVTAGARADAARQKMSQFADSVKQLGAVGDVAGATAEKVGQQSLAARLQSAKTLLQQVKSEGRKLTKAQVQELKNLQLTNNLDFVEVRRGPEKGLLVAQGKITNLLGTQSALQAEIDSAGRGYLETQTKIVQATKAVTVAQGVQRRQEEESKTAESTAIDLTGEKDAKIKSLESYHSLQDQLAKAQTQGEIDRIQDAFDHRFNLINAAYDLEDARANSFQKATITFQKELLAIEQKRQQSAIRAQAEVLKAQGSVAGGAPLAPALPPPSGSGGAAFDTGMRTGPSSAIGGSADYHQDIMFGSTVSMKERVQLMDQLARGYEKMGRAIEFSNAGVAGERYRSSMSYEAKSSLISRAQAAHANRPGGSGRAAMDFYAPLASSNRFGRSVEGQAMLAPSVEGASYSYGGGGRAGRTMTASRGGAMVYEQLHGSMAVPLQAKAPAPVKASERREEVAAVTAAIAVRRESTLALNAEEIAVQETAIAYEKYVASIAPIAEQELQNSLLEKRIQLMNSGVTGDFLETQMKIFEAEEKTRIAGEMLDKTNAAQVEGYQRLQKALPGYIASLRDAAIAQEDLNFATAQSDLAKRKAMAGALTADAELRVELAQKYPGNLARQEEEFSETKLVQGMEKVKQDLQGIASSISDAFGNAFKGIITGSMTAQQALAGFFQSVADSFADMVAKMIAEYLKMALIKGIMSMIPGLGPVGKTDLGSPSANLDQYAPLQPYANGGIAPGGFTAFANGGIVTGPTLGLVGEGRYNEAVIPLPDGKSVPVQLSGGDGGNQINSNITVNVSNGQAQSNATGSNSSELGRKIEGAVKQVIVGELRPGGLLASR